MVLLVGLCPNVRPNLGPWHHIRKEWEWEWGEFCKKQFCPNRTEASGMWKVLGARCGAVACGCALDLFIPYTTRMATERLVSATPQATDQEWAGSSLRPDSIEEYVGQADLLEKLSIAIEAAKVRV
ncbi:hypothetical protein MNBD_PLANCTO03-105, partial [hydrothermal vent metagenome]